MTPAWRSVGSTAAAKVAVMGVSGLIGILTSRMIVTNFGVESFAQYGLLTTLSSLLPFADLGLAAVVINAVAQSRDPRRDPYVARAIASAFRVLLVSGAVIATVAVILYTTGMWRLLLGDGLTPGAGEAAAALCMVTFGLAVPLSVGQRILVGLGKTTTQVATQAVVAPFMFLSIGACVLFNVPAGNFIAVFSYIGSALVSIICLIIAARGLTPNLRTAVVDIPKLRTAPSVPVLHLAWPMLVQMVALPVAMQTDRILVSQLGTTQDLAEYNLSFQLFAIALQTVSAAGVALWPIFARARTSAEIIAPHKPMLWFLAGGLFMAGVMAVLSPFLAHFVSDGAIQLPLALILSFVAFVAVQAMKYPPGMYMTDERGLKFQVLPTLIMIPISVGLSIALIPSWGAAGAIFGSVIAVLVCQVVPYYLYVLRDIRHRREEVDPDAPSE